jgi:hypothetical protein
MGSTLEQFAPACHRPTARSETVMSDWAVLEPAAENRPGKVRQVRGYTLKPVRRPAYEPP